ncbi:MAG: hypothetical protein JXR10_04090 [Cyclobacteriaceae bacterium]
MRKYLLVLIVLFTFCQESVSQKTDPFVLMFEFFGPARLFSLNGEYAVLQRDNYQINARLGGFSFFQKENYINIIGGGNAIINIHNSQHLEVGSAISYIYGLEGTELNDVPFVSEAIYFSPSIGYRYDDLVKGLVFRFSWSPLFPLYDFLTKENINRRWSNAGYNTSSLDYKRDFVYANRHAGYIGVTMGFRF